MFFRVRKLQASRALIGAFGLGMAFLLLAGVIQFLHGSVADVLAQDDTQPLPTPLPEPVNTVVITRTAPQPVTAPVTETVPVTGTTPITETAPISEPVVVEAMTMTVYMPLAAQAPPVPTLSATRPNSNNDWTMNWTIPTVMGVTGYELQQSQTADFSSGVTSVPLGTVNSYAVTTITPSPNNKYFYRIRSVAGAAQSGWSDVVTVLGGYRDNFSDNTTGWGMRRTTYLEQTNVYYGSGNEAGYLVVVVGDRWDWVLGSPLKEAPQVPYAIEYRSKVHDASNLVSGGAVLGGDWNKEACPEIGNVYRTDNCFNHFYNFNYIFYGPLKLLFEQVNRLEWCLGCSGSPLKRLGSTIDHGSVLPNPATDWNTYRMEVRADGIRLYINGKFERHFTDTSFINDPYFGVFASTDEYKPSIWFYEYYEVMPLD